MTYWLALGVLVHPFFLLGCVFTWQSLRGGTGQEMPVLFVFYVPFSTGVAVGIIGLETYARFFS